MTPSNYIEAAALKVLAKYDVPGTFLYASAVQAGIEANTSPMPMILLFDYTTNLKATTARAERADCTLYFADVKPGQGDSAEIEADAVQRMTQLKRRFLSALDNSPFVEITNMRATPFHDAYAAKLTGIGMQFTLGVPAGFFCEPRLVPVPVQLVAALPYSIPFALA